MIPKLHFAFWLLHRMAVLCLQSFPAAPSPLLRTMVLVWCLPGISFLPVIGEFTFHRCSILQFLRGPVHTQLQVGSRLIKTANLFSCPRDWMRRGHVTVVGQWEVWIPGLRGDRRDSSSFCAQYRVRAPTALAILLLRGGNEKVPRGGNDHA